MSLHMVGLLHVAPRSMGLLCSVPHPFCYRVAINIKKIIIMQSFTKRERPVFAPLVIAAVGPSWLLRGFLTREFIALHYVLPQDAH